MRILFLSAAIVLFGVTTHAQNPCTTVARLPTMSAKQQQILTGQLDSAATIYRKDSSNADAMIWYGRRMAYLGRYGDAIAIFSKGIALYPNDARFYRHRGHRYITLRCLDLAIPDLERAALLIANQPDQVEPDGMPNAQNIPTSTLQSNIWYHLGLAYYLKGDYQRAHDAYVNCLRVSTNPDMYVATANWLFITLKRLRREDEAANLLTGISTDMKLIENKDYLRLLLLYKGVEDAEKMKNELMGTGSSLSNASVGYGLGNYFILKGDKSSATAIFQKILAGDQWASFGFIAAEKAMEAVR